jgi:hypothetical protein
VSKTPRPRIARPIVELSGPAILLQELVDDEGVDRVMRAVERGLKIYDATTAFMVQRPAFEVFDDERLNPELVLGEAKDRADALETCGTGKRRSSRGR